MAIGITGTIGSGKSTVTKYLSDKGYKIFSCDEYNKELLLEGSKAYPKIKKAFPEAFIDDVLDKKILADIIFNDVEKKEILENILHPLIIKKMKQEIKKNALIFCEVPLLFEADLDELFENILLVICDEEIALKRLKKRGLSLKDSEARIANQMDVETKVSRADYLIYNNGSLKDLYKNIDKWLKEYVGV